MSITTNDMQAFLSAEVSDDDPAANGGRPADTTMPLSTKNNAFPDVNSAQRTAGERRWRKIFLANLNNQNLAGEAVMVVQDNPTAFGDYAYFTPADWDEHESDLTGNEPMYGTANLALDAAAGASLIDLALEDAALAAMLAAGREILVTSRSAFENTSSTVGVEELHTITSVAVSGTTATVGLAEPLAHDFAVSAGARASVVYRPPDQRPQVTDWNLPWACPVQLGNRGTIRQRWTLTYINTSTFELSGDTVGNLGEFSILQPCAPTNPAAWAAGAPYLTIPANGMPSGTAGESITFTTSPAMTPIWVNNTIPAGTAEYGPTDVGIGWQVESPA